MARGRVGGRWWSPRSPQAIALTVVLAAAVAAAQGSVSSALLRGAMTIALVPCALIDLDRRIIPNRITGPATLVALVAGSALDFGTEPRRLIAGVAAGGFLLIAAFIRPAGMGMGDVKLLGMMGFFLGPSVGVALILALLGSVLTGVALAPRRGIAGARKTALPFGPYLAAAGIVAACVGDPLLHLYLHRIH